MTTANPPLTLAAVLPPERVRASLSAPSREALFAALVDLAMPTALAAERRVALEAVLHREAELPTAMGDGLAVPHGRVGIAALTAAAATFPAIDGYVGPDGAPVRLAVLLLTPDGDARSHLQVLALLARRWHDRSVRAAIIDSEDDATLAARLGGRDS